MHKRPHTVYTLCFLGGGGQEHLRVCIDGMDLQIKYVCVCENGNEWCDAMDMCIVIGTQ